MVSKIETLESEIKILKSQEMKEKEANIIYHLYPKLMKKAKAKEQNRMANDKVLVLLKNFVERSEVSGYVKSRAIIKRINGYLKFDDVIVEKGEDKP